MRNCLKCSEFDSFEKWCNLHNRHVLPSDSCNAADINGSSLIGENCASCSYFSKSGVTGSGGYCRYHRTVTQSGNGCERFDSASPTSVENEYGYNLRGQATSASDGSGIIGAIIGAVMLFGLIGAIFDIIKKHAHVMVPILIMIITISVSFFLWAVHEGGKIEKRKSGINCDIENKKFYSLPLKILGVGIILSFICHFWFKP